MRPRRSEVRSTPDHVSIVFEPADAQVDARLDPVSVNDLHDAFAVLSRAQHTLVRLHERCRQLNDYEAVTLQVASLTARLSDAESETAQLRAALRETRQQLEQSRQDCSDVEDKLALLQGAISQMLAGPLREVTGEPVKTREKPAA